MLAEYGAAFVFYTARKLYRCDPCRGPIRVGHRYRRLTLFPGHCGNSAKVPSVLRVCLYCDLRDDDGAHLFANACASWCCGDTPCARPFGHPDDNIGHSCGGGWYCAARTALVAREMQAADAT